MNNDIEFVFLDLETTGLDPKDDVILEVGIILTTINLDVIAAKSFPVLDKDWEMKLARNKYVQNMHILSGLHKD
jgi:oligoribonuclease (3'-5' exoribonuclease)